MCLMEVKRYSELFNFDKKAKSREIYTVLYPIEPYQLFVVSKKTLWALFLAVNGIVGIDFLSIFVVKPDSSNPTSALIYG